MTPTRMLSIFSAFLVSSTTLFGSFVDFADGDFDVPDPGAENSSDTYRVGVDMHITTLNNTGWNTLGATLQFINNLNLAGSFSNVNHTLDYSSGQNLGDTTYAGYTDNFAWGTVDVIWDPLNNNGNTLNYTNGALYTQALLLGGGNLAAAQAQLALFSGNGILYYDINNATNSYLAGGTYAFGSGTGFVAPVPIAPIPEPGSAIFGLLVAGVIARSAFNRRSRK